MEKKSTPCPLTYGRGLSPAENLSGSPWAECGSRRVQPCLPLLLQLRRPGALRVSPGCRQPGQAAFSDKTTAQESLERGLGGETMLSCWPGLRTRPPAGFSVSGEATRACSFEGLAASASIECFAARPPLGGFWVLVALGHKSDSMFSRRRRRAGLQKRGFRPCEVGRSGHAG